MGEPSWVQHSLWWHVYPLGFLGADTTGVDRRPGGGAAGVGARLRGDSGQEDLPRDDVPRDESPRDAMPRDHTLRDLIPWLDYLTELGLNGLALGPIFAGETHGYDTVDYFRIDERLGTDDDFDALVAGCRERGVRLMLDGVFNHVGRSYPDREELQSDSVFEGHESLVELDHGRPEVAQLVTRVMDHWLSRGADAWRLDAAYAVPPAFWRSVLPAIRERHPQVYVVGEILHGDYAELVRASGMDACTQYELWKATWSALNDRNFFELEWGLRRNDEMLATMVPWTFLGNHDVTRIASQLVDERLLPLALVLLLTLPGTPAVYYGDEQGFRGVKEERAGGDDEIRPAFPATPADLSPLGWPVYRLMQELIGLRRRHSWVHRARVETVHLTNEQFVYVVAAHEDPGVPGVPGDLGGQDGPGDHGDLGEQDGPGNQNGPGDVERRLLVALNAGEEPVDVPLTRVGAGGPAGAGNVGGDRDGEVGPREEGGSSDQGVAGGRLRRIAGSAELIPADGAPNAVVRMPGYGWGVFEVGGR
ncbi:alpha-amylase family glycosyl hydrolase [Flexivirga meconopsidis]|uniref:alpha-amylase family glycosyl hydrolase n=1 Tax=Flexivirga meconopsidis TaxID=2977121 RepID=UPI0022401D86|nr:alpha-amylase family glycosyl hydrolase [Flexivirga meconopsidis]